MELDGSEKAFDNDSCDVILVGAPQLAGKWIYVGDCNDQPYYLRSYKCIWFDSGEDLWVITDSALVGSPNADLYAYLDANYLFLDNSQLNEGKS